ncbi:hypothetical protein [Streptomyces sp. SBT349]|uniref:hypothetical protein n=1 Tax=Streptomyces sp. SBT349 TaxID=1580539 RepID=UPI00066A7573|nr:hypothetical protein [Streptomyces sp. SBT349]
MRNFIGAHEVLSEDDFTELALGLLLGEENESEKERDARLDAARDLFTEDPELADCRDRLARQIAEQLLATPVPELLSTVLVINRPRRARKAVAA